MSVPIIMEDASKHVKILLGHSTVLVKLDTILTVTSAPVMISMSVLLVMDHSSADVLVVKRMIRSLTDVLHQTIVLAAHVNINVSVVAVPITATACQDTI